MSGLRAGLWAAPREDGHHGGIGSACMAAVGTGCGAEGTAREPALGVPGVVPRSPGKRPANVGL